MVVALIEYKGNARYECYAHPSNQPTKPSNCRRFKLSSSRTAHSQTPLSFLSAGPYESYSKLVLFSAVHQRPSTPITLSNPQSIHPSQPLNLSSLPTTIPDVPGVPGSTLCSHTPLSPPLSSTANSPNLPPALPNLCAKRGQSWVTVAKTPTTTTTHTITTHSFFFFFFSSSSSFLTSFHHHLLTRWVTQRPLLVLHFLLGQEDHCPFL